MNSANKVAEIFTAAGQAFSRLGDLTMQLHPSADTPTGKWTEDEIDMLHSSIVRFSDDLNNISSCIKNRTVSQIRQALKKKAFDEAGIPAKQVPVQQVQQVIQTAQQQHHHQQQQMPQILNAVQNQLTGSGNSIIVQQPSQLQRSARTTKHSPVHIQHVQHILPLNAQHINQQQQASPLSSGSIVASTAPTAVLQHAPLQTPPKQIIIQSAGNIITTSGTPHQSTPQIVHLQTQQLQQTIHQPQITTMTVQQYQQHVQQQKLLAASAATSSPSVTVLPSTSAAAVLPSSTAAAVLPATSAAIASASSLVALQNSNITENSSSNVVLQQSVQRLTQLPNVVTPQPSPGSLTTHSGAVASPIMAQTVPAVVPAAVASPSPTTKSTPESSLNNGNAASLPLTTAPSSSTATAASVVNNNNNNNNNNNSATVTNVITLKPATPDVMMTLNRINAAQENEVDVEECLPAEVVKLDFAGGEEEVAG